jgi:hypothetical protein
VITTSTLEHPPDRDNDSAIAPLVRAVFVIAAAKTAFFLATSGIWGLHRDEFYYLAGGRHLEWGYVDHPPVTPLLYRIGETVFGSSQSGIHTVPAGSPANWAGAAPHRSSPPPEWPSARCSSRRRTSCRR